MDVFLTCLLATLEDYQADLSPLMITKDVLIFWLSLNVCFPSLCCHVGSVNSNLHPSRLDIVQSWRLLFNIVHI